jgi:hypothetical protein
MILDNFDIFGELTKYLTFRSILSLQKTCQLYYNFVKNMFNNVEEYKFLKDNNITTVNKVFELRINDELNFDKILQLPNFSSQHKCRWKHNRINYIYGKIHVSINVENKLIISGCKSYLEAYEKVNQIFLLFLNNNIVHQLPNIDKLRELYTIIEFWDNIYSGRIKKNYSFYKLIYNKI